jgi:1-deoxy-D-xylulose-5-phosphate reductoisomerase
MAMSGQRREIQSVVILGSTGSVGTSTLDVVAALPDRFRVVGLAASRNIDALQEQIDRFKPRYAACGAFGRHLRNVTVVDGDRQLSELATLDEADIVVVATTGHDAIQPTIDALKAGKIVALANKESIVAAGELVMAAAREGPGELRPVDSEHSALWQCLSAAGGATSQVERLILTASGGPFRGFSHEQLRTVTPAQALRHPNWNMGAKITIDSATLMNKGLEVIEAMWLFDVDIDRIDVVVHPQSLIHSLVEFVDGSIIAQLGSHDMRLPIQYALTYPDRVKGCAAKLNVFDLGHLEFERPDESVFPLLSVARQAAKMGATYPTVLSVSDSVAVQGFLDGRIRFDQIPVVVQTTLERHSSHPQSISIESIEHARAWAEHTAKVHIEHVATRG